MIWNHREPRANALARFTALWILVMPLSVPAANSPERVRAFSRLPEWTGLWQAAFWGGTDVSGRFPEASEPEVIRANSQLAQHPPYNTEWEARYQRDLKDNAQSVAAANYKICKRG